MGGPSLEVTLRELRYGRFAENTPVSDGTRPTAAVTDTVFSMLEIANSMIGSTYAAAMPLYMVRSDAAWGFDWTGPGLGLATVLWGVLRPFAVPILSTLQLQRGAAIGRGPN
jgi:hypothetical protein